MATNFTEYRLVDRRTREPLLGDFDRARGFVLGFASRYHFGDPFRMRFYGQALAALRGRGEHRGVRIVFADRVAVSDLAIEALLVETRIVEAQDYPEVPARFLSEADEIVATLGLEPRFGSAIRAVGIDDPQSLVGETFFVNGKLARGLCLAQRRGETVLLADVQER